METIKDIIIGLMGFVGVLVIIRGIIWAVVSGYLLAKNHKSGWKIWDFSDY